MIMVQGRHTWVVVDERLPELVLQRRIHLLTVHFLHRPTTVLRLLRWVLGVHVVEQLVVIVRGSNLKFCRGVVCVCTHDASYWYRRKYHRDKSKKQNRMTSSFDCTSTLSKTYTVGQSYLRATEALELPTYLPRLYKKREK
jgi:hypothetical protein